MFHDEIKIPKQRVAVLIGKEGETKKLIQDKTQTELEIDSKEGFVIINCDDSLQLLNVEKVIQAIGRGFNPTISLSLLNDKNCLEIIPIREFSGKSRKKELRLKSRIIGAKGKCRKTIEYITHTHLSIFGKTISVLGKVESVSIVKQAICDILSGAPHGPVYGVLEKRMKELKQ